MKIPTVFAVGVWAASGLAVLTYTYIAFKETATGLESGALAVAEHAAVAANPLVAGSEVLLAEQVAAPPEKKLDRNRFTPSPRR
jgi:hypothetical protein